MTIAEKLTAEKLTTIAENEPKVYDDGYAKGETEGYSQAESDFWDSFTDNGERKFYEYGFCRTAFEQLRPKYKVVPTSRSICMFEEIKNTKVIEKAYFDLSKCQITTQAAGTGGHYATFRGTEGSGLEVIEDIGLQAGGYYQTFRHLQKLHTLEVLRVLETTSFDATFTYCFALENLTIEGTIGKNGFSVKDSTKLSHASHISIFNALSLTTTGLTVTFNRTAVNKAFETAEGANDGTTSAEWLSLVAAHNNWTISLSN